MKMGASVNFKDELARRTARAEEILKQYLPPEEGFAAQAARAMNYSLQAGGKRLRPVMMEEAWRMYGGTGREIEPFMAGMEMIHTHSLIHDDLPALDNDDTRRGKPTSHVVFGEAMAILAGDMLLNHAYETMLKAFCMTEHPDRAARALCVMAEKTGIRGMLGGQSVDVENDGTPLDRDLLNYIYENKTSALIEASLMTGALLAGAEQAAVEVMEACGRRIGLAFQIVDDILDVTGETAALGKPVHSDEKNHKTTYVTLYGLDRSRKKAEELTEEAIGMLEQSGTDCAFMKELFRALSARTR